MVRRVVGISVLTAAVLLTASALAQNAKFEVPREKVLSIGFQTTTPPAPVVAGPTFNPSSAKTWSGSITHPNTKGLRLHVTIATAGTGPWKLRVKDAANEVADEIESTSPLVTTKAFWTKEVKGSSAKVELSADQALTGTSLSIDKYAFRVSPSNPQGTVGDDDKQPIGQAPAQVKGWAPPVARLTIMTPLGGGFCTGFMLNDTLLMTNEHCIHDEEEAVSTTAEFGYDTATSQPDVVRVTKLMALDPGLDFAIVRLEKKPPAKYGHVTLETQSGVVDDSALAVIQHPQGEPKMVSLVDCKVRGIDRIGVGDEHTDFGHLCDTLRGSSGSPVFALSSGHVVGLHHLGYPEGTQDPENQGVRFTEIVKLLKAKHQALATELQLP